MRDYIVLDLENPNARGNSICALAVLVVRNGEIIEKKYSLINPEDRFDEINMRITGINTNMVQDAPTLEEYWNEIKELLENNVIVGHNISYDISVLSKSLARYDIKIPKFSYCCTLELSKKLLQEKTFKLENLVANLGYTYNAHIASEDAMASYVLFEYLKKEFGFDDKSIHNISYEMRTNDNLDERLITNLNQLNGIIDGIVCDSEINEKELERLHIWIDENIIYKQYTLFNKIISELVVVIEDNVIDEYEKVKLQRLVGCINKSKLYSETTLGMQVLQGIIDGISCDEKINLTEIKCLQRWLQEHDYLSGVYPYDKILCTVSDTLADGILDENEKIELLNTFKEILNPIDVNGSEAEIDLNDKTFCLSGEFKCGSKADVKGKLVALGGIEKSGVSAKLDYLFVGGMGSDAWKYGKVGGKIAKALELQEKGNKVQIIAEEDLIKIF